MAFWFLNSAVFAQQSEFKLWETIPDSKMDASYSEEQDLDQGNLRGYRKITQPTLTVFEPHSKIKNGSAVVICPGGGYGYLAISHEGYDLGKWFAAHGVTGFVLKYRLPSDQIMQNKTIGPLQDVQRAVRYIRQNASQYNLDPAKIGVMGFSAGGHLASTAATHYGDAVYNANEGVSARPDFSVLIYPVVSMQKGITHSGSRNNLLGKNPTQAEVYKYSGEYQVTADTPATFIVHATDDASVPVENSINYFLALKNAGVNAEMHLYEDGGHGFGMGRSTTSNTWPQALILWMKKHSLIAE